MALTLKADQRLGKASLHKLFGDGTRKWTNLAKHAHDFVGNNFPDKAIIRPDDVAQALTPVLEVDQQLVDYLNSKKLTQKYWIRDFCDLILDRTWKQL